MTTDWREEYPILVTIGEHGECGLIRFLYTTGIVSGLNEWGYEDRWCYRTYEDAYRALMEWKDSPEDPEPDGWHRHPGSGRRRTNGDPKTEYINR